MTDNLPAGAAGYLINRSHAYPDLKLPVSRRELRLVEAIDGRLRADQLIRGAGIRTPEQARPFLQKLWWYDQVSFA